MQIQVDTREHKKEWERVQKQFDKIENIQYFRSKLYVGDYQSLDNPRLVIDRKKDLQELCGNVTQQHERFKAELIRAMQAGIQVVILVEHGTDINCLEDVTPEHGYPICGDIIFAVPVREYTEAPDDVEKMKAKMLKDFDFLMEVQE